MSVCSVIGCQSRSSTSPAGSKHHFFRFPKENLKNNKVRENFIKFCKRKDFNPKESSAICDKHFTFECFVIKKKGRLYLAKDSVPTIYEKCQGNKIERIEVLYNPETQEYINIDDITITQNMAERERQMLADRDQRVLEAKSSCRFCLESDKDIKCVSVRKLNAFLNESLESLNLLDLNTHYNELMSELVCEKCFQVIVDFDAYKKRCQKAQNDFVIEIQEIDDKIEEFKNSKSEETSWYKEEESHEEVIGEIIAEEAEVNLDLIEEHLEDEVYDENVYEDTFAVEENKNLPQDDDDDDLIEEDEIDEENFNKSIIKIDPEEIYEEKDRYEVADKNIIIENPLRNPAPHRIYECFFCKLKFAGQKTYKTHDCQVKEIKCEVEGCHKMFTKQSGYNQHIVKIHGHTKFSKHFCAICRQVINASEDQFKRHRKLCNRKLNFEDQKIECEICKKSCKNLKSYTIHKMFHDSRNIIKNLKESHPPKKSSSSSKGPVICELCGNKFTNSQGLRTHKKNVHLIGSSGEVYQCDICSKIRPTKRSLFNHMRNVHRVQKTPCSVCGKIFRTKALLQKHMMYHDETKRIHFCPLCPDKPGYFTAVALRRHQKSHHIGLRQFSCDFCEASYTSSHMLKQHHRQHHDIVTE